MTEKIPFTKQHRTLSAQTSSLCVMVIFFCSGVCSLIDEVVWLRLLKLTLGNTVYASSVVVSVFMGGLALGALIMSRFADRVKRPLLLYALLEIVVSVVTITIPFALSSADGIYRILFVKFQSSPQILIALQLALSSAILLVPTMLMGSTLPLLGGFIALGESRVGSRVGRLYAINTFGAATGCFLAGFILVRTIGVLPTLYVAAGVNALVAFAGFALSRAIGSFSLAVNRSTPNAQPISLVVNIFSRRLLIILFFTSGCISIGYELIWMRSIVIPLGGFTYVFSSVLFIYLLGNVVGAWIGSSLSRRIKNPAFGAALCLVLLGICGIAYMPWFSGLLWNIFDLSNAVLLPFAKNPWVSVLAKPLLFSGIMFLPAAIIMGVGFPLALQAWKNSGQGTGRTTGFVYGINTVGAICGGILTGFVLIPFIGTQRSIVWLGLLGTVLGSIGIQVFFGTGHRFLRIAFAVISVGIIALGMALPSDVFIKKIVAIPKTQTIAVKEGLTATVSVTKRLSDGALELTSDGIRIAGDDLHRSAQQCLGNIGVLLHPQAKNVLSVGFGSGETVKCLSQYHLRHIDCVEIAPELIDLAHKHFSHLNQGVFIDTSLSLISMDAFNYMHVTNKTYDVIINDANLPSHSSCAPLFTKDHFKNCANHLNPRGLFITKLPLADISETTFHSILGTFLTSFPAVTLWFPVTHPYIFFYLIGSREPQFYSPMAIDKLLSGDTARAASDFLRFRTGHDVLSCYIGDQTDIARYLKNYTVNSNNIPFIEFNVDQKQFPLKPFFKRITGTMRSASLYDHLDWKGYSPEQKTAWCVDNRALDTASTCVLKLVSEENPVQKLLLCSQGLRLLPKNQVLEDNEEKALMALDNIVVGLLQNMQATEAASYCDTILALAPAHARARFNRGMAMHAKSQDEQAIIDFCQGVKLEPGNALAWRILGDLYNGIGNRRLSAQAYRQALGIDSTNADAQNGLKALGNY